MTDRDLDRRRWAILVASCLVNLCIGSLYAWSVFAMPMAEYLAELSGGEPQNLAMVFTLANAVGPITMISGGAINDRLGPRRIIMAGGILFGIGMIASGFATSPQMLLGTYGLGVGLGVGMVYGATVSNTVKFFPDKSGLAGGLATASYGLSSVVVPIVANALIGGFGVAHSFMVLGAAMLVVICVASFVIEACPAGYVPAGWSPAEMPGGSSRAGEGLAVRAPKRWNEMLRDPVFYSMIAMLCCGAFAGLMVTSQASAIAQDMMGMDAGTAALIVSVLALLNTAGRIASGALSDRIGPVATIRVVFVLAAAAMGVLYVSASGQMALFCAGICLAGFCFGSIMGVYPGFTAAQFGAAYNSVNYGIMFIGFAAAGYFGPAIMSTLHAATDAYGPAFLVALGLSMVGFVLTFLYGVQQRCRALG